MSNSKIASLPSAWVLTDKPNYSPGDVAKITGGGFQIGETVQLQVSNLTNGNTYTPPWTVTDGVYTTDPNTGAIIGGDLDGKADGNIATSWTVVSDAANSTLKLTAITTRFWQTMWPLALSARVTSRLARLRPA